MQSAIRVVYDRIAATELMLKLSGREKGDVGASVVVDDSIATGNRHHRADSRNVDLRVKQCC